MPGVRAAGRIVFGCVRDGAAGCLAGRAGGAVGELSVERVRSPSGCGGPYVTAGCGFGRETLRTGCPIFAREFSHWPISQRIRSSELHAGVGWPHFAQKGWMGVFAPQFEHTKRLLRATFPPQANTSELP